MADQELARRAAEVGGFTAVTVEEPCPWRSTRPPRCTTYLVMANEDDRVQRLGASIAEAMADHRQRCALDSSTGTVVDVPQEVTRHLNDMLGLVVEARPPADLEPVDVLLLARAVSGMLARAAGAAQCARSGAIPIPFGRHVSITTVSA